MMSVRGFTKPGGFVYPEVENGPMQRHFSPYTDNGG